MSALLRGIIFLVFGPLIGVSLFFLMGTGQDALALMAPFIFFIPAYMVGTIPALFSVVLVGRLRWRGFSHRRTLIWAAVIGAISTCLPLSAASLFIEIRPSLILLIIVIASSLTCFICELSAIVLTNLHIKLDCPFSLKEIQFALRPDAVLRPTSPPGMRLPVILGLLGFAPIAALWIVVITKSKKSYPIVVSNISNIR